MENKDSVNLNSNGEEHKPEVNEVIAAEAASNEEFNEMMAKASESVSEMPLNNEVDEQGPLESEGEAIDEGAKIMQAEQNMEVGADLVEENTSESKKVIEETVNHPSTPVVNESEETNVEEEAHHELILQQIEEHVEEIADLENYDAMDKSTLIEKFTALLEHDDAAVNKNKAFAIKDAFTKIITQDRNEDHANFME